jgi:hypothetical protein
VAAMSRHSVRIALRPRRLKRSMPRLNLVWAKTGLDDRLALTVELAAALAGQDPAHECVEIAVPARPGALAALA